MGCFGLSFKHVAASGTLLFCLIGVLNGGRIKRNALEFRDMVAAATGRDPYDFYGYGHYCGLGGRGSVIDPIDECCREHDECYGEQKMANCGIFIPKYTWANTMLGITCLDDPFDFCKRHLCECDKACAECFAATNEFYLPGHTRPDHKFANSVFHFLDPIERAIKKGLKKHGPWKKRPRMPFPQTDAILVPLK